MHMCEFKLFLLGEFCLFISTRQQISRNVGQVFKNLFLLHIFLTTSWKWVKVRQTWQEINDRTDILVEDTETVSNAGSRKTTIEEVGLSKPYFLIKRAANPPAARPAARQE